jgi:urate oxidase
MIGLAENRYGKSRVRLVKVKRHPDRHDLREWALEILLEGDFESCFKDGDNSNILPTDTMKNTVYSLARSSSAACMEDFGKELISFLLGRNPQVSAGQVTLSEKAWEHLESHGKPHPTAFRKASEELQTTEVMLKTAGSEFAGFIKDSLTTLPEARDRLFGTAVRARWGYSSEDVRFENLRCRLRETLITVFAEHTSKSVQHTLYAMGEAALERISEIDDIQLTMPNIHCLLVDLSRFGQDNPNEIFVPIDEPHGYIEAHIRRRG